MHKLVYLIEGVRTDPSLLKHLEIEVMHASKDLLDYSVLNVLLETNLPDCLFYAMLILEHRLKNIPLMQGDKSLAIQSSTNFITFCLNKFSTFSGPINILNKLSDSAALSIIFFYPTYFPDIFVVIYNLVSSRSILGYFVFHRYIYLVNCSTNISSDRRSELKRITKEMCQKIILIIIEQYKNNLISNNVNKTLILATIIQTLTCFLTFTRDADLFLDFVISYGYEVSNDSLDFFSSVVDNFLTPVILQRIIAFSNNQTDLFKEEILNILYYNLNSQHIRKIYFNEESCVKFFYDMIDSELCYQQCLDFFERYFKFLKGSDKCESIAIEIIKKVIIKVNSLNLKKSKVIKSDQLDSSTDEKYNYDNINSNNNKTDCFSNNGSNNIDSYNIGNNKMDPYSNNSSNQFNKSVLDNDVVFTDEDALDISKSEDFIRGVSLILPKLNYFLLLNYSNHIPVSLSSILLKNCQKRDELSFNDNYLNCYKYLLSSRTECINYLEYLDYDNLDHSKLASKILKKYPVLDSKICIKIINRIKGDNGDDVLITCMSILKKQGNDLFNISPHIKRIMEGEWSNRKKKLFVSFIRRDLENVKDMINSFYYYFLNKTNEIKTDEEIIKSNILDIQIIAALKRKTQVIPQEILGKVYNKIEIYNIKCITVIINEFLCTFEDEIILFFLEPIYKKIIIEHEQLSQEETSPCIKSFLNMIERRICELRIITCMDETANEKPNNTVQNSINIYIQSLTELLNIKEPFIVRKIHDVFIKNELEYDKTTVIYKLLILYNSNEMIEGQPDIINFLVTIINTIPSIESQNIYEKEIYYKNSPLNVLFNIPNTDTIKIESLEKGVKDGTMKSKREIMKMFLNEVKGKHLREMFEKGIKIEKQFTKEKKLSENTPDLSSFHDEKN